MATADSRQPPAPGPFGQLLKRLRIAADITQEELAEQAGVSARLVSDLERGVIQRPRRSTVTMLADALRLTAEQRERFVATARGRAAAEPDEPEVILPAVSDPLVGRERELAVALVLLQQPEPRLLTLTGPGGVGKTRLALAAAARAAPAFPDGVHVVDLAPLADPAQVLPAIARATGLRDHGDGSLRAQLLATLRDARALLLLDNLEHLTAAAPDLAALLDGCPRVTLLATSRQPLRLRSERELPLGPLALPEETPDLDALRANPAVALFVRRAQAARPSFALSAANAREIAGIVRRLDGLPLAIELAAARIRLLSPAELLARLERRLPLLSGGAPDLPARQRTMRATIDWSYELLGPDEQWLFRRLAVFSGGCMLDAVEALAHAAGHVELEVLDALAALTDQSLLRVLDPPGSQPDRDAPRFGMLETIRELGLEKLAAAGEEPAARDEHAGWCLALAEQAEPELTGPDQRQWFARLAAEHDNLRAALDRLLATGDAARALRLAGALNRFWATEGHYAEARVWLERALALPDDGEPTVRAKALISLGVIAYFQGDYEQAVAATEEARQQYQTAGDISGVGSALGNLGLLADAQEDYPRASALYGEALAIFRLLDDQTRIGFMLNNLGLIAQFEGDLERAEALHAEALALRQALGDPEGVAFSYGNLGQVAFVKQEYARAAQLQAAALRVRRELSNRAGLARCLENIALIAIATGEPGRGARLYAAASTLREQLGTTIPPNDREFNARWLDAAQHALGPDGYAASWAGGAELPLDEALDEALAWCGEQSAVSNQRSAVSGRGMTRQTTGLDAC